MQFLGVFTSQRNIISVEYCPILSGSLDLGTVFRMVAVVVAVEVDTALYGALFSNRSC